MKYYAVVTFGIPPKALDHRSRFYRLKKNALRDARRLADTGTVSTIRVLEYEDLRSAKRADISDLNKVVWMS